MPITETAAKHAVQSAAQPTDDAVTEQAWGEARPAGSFRRTLIDRARDERGAETAEYAIATMAAVAFAGLLVAIMQSDTVRGMLEDLVERALTFVG